MSEWIADRIKEGSSHQGAIIAAGADSSIIRWNASYGSWIICDLSFGVFGRC